MQRRSCANRFSAALLFLMVLAAGSMSARAADATALVPAEDFVRPAQMGSIKFSPDGRHFAALAENKGFMQLVVADAGVSDLTWMVELPETDFNWHANRRIDAELKSRIGNPDDPIERKVMDAHSPRLLAARIKAPVLLVYGTDDRRVPLRHGTAMRDALQAAGGVCEWKTYTGETRRTGPTCCG